MRSLKRRQYDTNISRDAARCCNGRQQIGGKNADVKELCDKLHWLLSELDYEPGETVLQEMLTSADEYSSGDYDVEDIVGGLFHDAICDYFYDHRADSDKWDTYWSAVDEASIVKYIEENTKQAA